MLGERIKDARKRSGRTQIDVAVLIGVTKQTVSQWESGRSPPTIGNLISFARVVDVDVSELFTGISGDLGPRSLTERRLAATSTLIPLHSIETCGRVLRGELKAMPDKFVATLGRHRDGAVALAITGRANHPRFREGDVVTLEPAGDADPGKWVLAWVDGEYVFRRYLPKTASTSVGATLRAFNEIFPPLVMGEGDLVLAVMAEHISTRHDD